MKKAELWKYVLVMMFVFVVPFLASGCATSGGAAAGYKMANRPADLPATAQVKVMREVDGGVVIGVKGVDVLYAEVYGRDIDRPQVFRTMLDGEWWMVFTLPTGRWFNFVFLAPDGLGHFVYFTEEDERMPPKWMDPSIAVFKPNGYNPALTARSFLRK